MKKRRLLLLYTSIGIFMLLCLKASIFADETLPKRIISLSPSITETFYLLGTDDRLIGVTTFCLRPPQAQKIEKIGTVTDVNIEKIVSLKPNLVLATSLTNLEAIKKLEGLGINVQVFPQPRNFIELCRQFLRLAKLVGEEKKASSIITSAKEKVNSIKERVKGLPRPNIFIQIGARPLFTVTKDSFVNDFIEFAGGINIAKNTSGLYSREEVLKKDPNVIIIVTMGVIGEKEKKIWQRYRTLRAVRDNRIYIIDSYKLCSPTPLGFADTLEEVVYILHLQGQGEKP